MRTVERADFRADAYLHVAAPQHRRPIMKLLTPDIQARLLENGRKQAPVRGTKDEIDFQPVVKLFAPDAGCTWLLTEIDPDDRDVAFGLYYLGRGYPELGFVRLSEIAAVRGKLGLPPERDLWFEGDKPLSAYAKEAARLERINA
jgi:hypothetical protein